MTVLPLGWQTDLAVLERTGSVVIPHHDHLVVATADNPAYHWGNSVLVTDQDTVDDSERWLRVFEEGFPGVAHRAIGFTAEPRPEVWNSQGLQIERDDVLEAGDVPRTGPPQTFHASRSAE